ncbi:MAG: choice-of-anchor D domain-containing protein [Planctomycetes bacterium]|nr:choice-of-anchor D domain-containing protein [Planctomycetota bacterium]
MKALATLILLTMAASLAAQDSGDAPASYGTMYSYFGSYSGSSLGTLNGDDPDNPVGGDWVSDDDDGIVGTPFWDPWSANNSLTVHVQGTGWLILWVDANDNGVWESTERYRYSQLYLEGPGNFTFSDIRLTAAQNFSRNGANKVAVRITLQENMGGGPRLVPNGFFYTGEVEDWLIDVAPISFSVATLELPEAIEGQPYQTDISAVHGRTPFQWSVVGGALPAGLSLTASGDNFRLAGTPSAGAGYGAQIYSVTVQATSAQQVVAQRTLTVRVLPAPVTAPFKDTFTNNMGWQLDNTWTRGVATYYVGGGSNRTGELTSEPEFDFTPGNNDNMILADSIGSYYVYNGFLPQPLWAVSPIVDCSALTQVRLRFRRWLSTRRAADWGIDRVKIQVSVDGTNWTTVWYPSVDSTAEALVDVAWSLCDCDLTAVAAGQPRVQVRFAIGPAADASYNNPGVTPMPDDFAGWCIDDVEIGAQPETTLQASAFDVQTTGTLMNPISSIVYPQLYPGSVHQWSALVDNPGTVPLTITEFEVGATIPIQAGATNYDIQDYRLHKDSWQNVGTWALSLPVVVPAGSNVVLNGTFTCTGVAPYRVNQTFQLKLYVRGDTPSGAGFEATDTLDVAFSGSPQPGLHVWEDNTSGTGQHEIFNGASWGGLRDYGTTIAGGASNWTLILCKNTSSSSFTVDPPTLTGGDPGEFELYWLNPWTSVPIQGQNNVWFYVRFKPTSAGIKTATVTFTHTAGNTTSPFTFGLRGVGASAGPVIRVIDTSTGGLISNGSSAVGGLDFGNVDIYGAPVSLTIEVENGGNQDLVLTQLPSISGDPAFTLDTTQTVLLIQPTQSTTFVIHFAPSTTGARGALISLPHNDTGTATPFEFNVAGFGIINAPVLRVTLAAPNGVQVAPGAAAAGATQFAPRDVNAGASMPLDVFVHNDGWQNLVLGALPALSGTHVGDFGIDNAAMTLVIAPNSYASFVLWFDPLAKGPKAATVEFTHNDAQVASAFTFALSGMGEDPNGVVITGSTLPTAKVGEVYTEVLPAGNGTAPYTWAQLAGALPPGLTLDPNGTLAGTPVDPHGMYTFRVRVTDALGGTDERWLHMPVAPATGHLSKGGSSDGGGCVAAPAGAAVWVWLLLIAAAARRRRKA